MFLETFNELQQKFIEVFGRFFPGGRAELVLVNHKPIPMARRVRMSREWTLLPNRLASVSRVLRCCPVGKRH